RSCPSAWPPWRWASAWPSSWAAWACVRSRPPPVTATVVVSTPEPAPAKAGPPRGAGLRHTGRMLSPALARRLLDAGLVWSPMPGDRFVVDRPGMEHDLFHLADMTVEVHTFVGGSVIGFNGVAEWALDSVAL